MKGLKMCGWITCNLILDRDFYVVIKSFNKTFIYVGKEGKKLHYWKQIE